MPLPTLLKSQTPQILSLIPKPPFSLSIPNRLSTTQTFTFSRKISQFPLYASFSYSSQQEQDDGDIVIGDCVVFEEGVFEDPFLRDDIVQKKPRKNNSKTIIEPESLVPEKWKEVQAEINITKKERRKIAQQLEFGSRVEKKKKGAIPLRDTEAYLSYRSNKLSQLKPVVIDKPSDPLEEDMGEDKDVGEFGCSLSGRVTPRNPRLAVYGTTFEGITEFLNSGNYVPGESASNKLEGRRKLFTTEEKVLLNKRIPNLAHATSGKWLPLHTLAASGEFYLVDALLKHNVNINAADKGGLTALHKAIISKKQAITNYLLRESANPFVRDKEGATLMHYAVQTASSQTIKILLLYNVDINLPDNNGWTPLHLAVQTRRTDLVRLLLIKGADETLKNQDGLTPLDLCLYSGRDARTYQLIKLMKQLPKKSRTV
ncbi:hypothetical protein HHK36_010379 [Tetracentron sinense]|uniref:Ankyrin repeat domain-containing protein, chloroplastic n=1 Tax=Tetracentron sinense TaxID=13715 RepID=A0A834ZHY7_TETSI|nr:hypothetical protein HHK36_010379 [Tetracentron sinense]